MPWAISNKNNRPLVWIVCALFAGLAACFFAWAPLKHRYQLWSAERQVTRAESFLADKDYDRAMLDARGVLVLDPMNISATRVMAKALDAINSPAAEGWRSRLDTLLPGEPENTVAWAADLLKIGDLATAERVLETLKPADRGSAEYHSTAAKVAMAKRDSVSAAKHWAEASRLRPEDDGYRLELASFRLGSKSMDERREAVEMLTEISRNPPKSVVALRTLLADAMGKRDLPRAVELADALVADPGATFGDKLMKLQTFRKIRLRESAGYLDELRNEAISNPENLYHLLMWMNQNDLALLVAEWVHAFPADVISVPPTCIAVADAYARSSDWNRLRDFVDGHAWGDWDYLRRVFLSRALERLDEAELSAREWKDGLAAARSRKDSTQRLERLARITVTWRWEQRANEVMWMLAGAPGCPRWVLEALWAQAMNRSDTAQLQKIAGLLAKADSKSVAFLKNYALFSLLIRSEDGNPHREAERLFNENPGNASVAMTWGLSLFQRGKIAEAIAVTGSLPSDALQRPQVALYHAIFLTAAGEGGKAAEFLAVAQDWKMFPEEKTMLDRAKTLAGKTAGDSEIAASAKALRAAKAARDLEAEKAVEAARAERMAKAAQAAQEAAQEAAQSPAPEKSGGRVPPR